jgi:hypothetical protein
VDFLEEPLAGAAGLAGEESYGQRVEGAVSQTIARAIQEATQSADPARRQAAASWLWVCCPDIAEQVELPDLHDETIPALAAAYVIP